MSTRLVKLLDLKKVAESSNLRDNQELFSVLSLVGELEHSERRDFLKKNVVWIF